MAETGAGPAGAQLAGETLGDRFPERGKEKLDLEAVQTSPPPRYQRASSATPAASRSMDTPKTPNEIPNDRNSAGCDIGMLASLPDV